MRLHPRFQALTTIGFFFSLSPAVSAQPSFQGLGHLPGGGVRSSAIAVSGDGSVVVGVSDSEFNNLEAFRWTVAEGMMNLGVGSPTALEARDVSEDGRTIVGMADLGPDSSWSAFRWTPSAGMELIGQMGPSAVSPDGSVVVGGVFRGNLHSDSVRWTEQDGIVVIDPGEGRLSAASGVSIDGTVIVGVNEYSEVVGRPYRWTAATGIEHLRVRENDTVPWGSSNAITPDGRTIVGWAQLPSGPQAFRWTETEGIVGLGGMEVGFMRSQATAVSADASVIVGNGMIGDSYPPFIWDEIHGVRLLSYVLSEVFQLEISDWVLLYVADVSANGHSIVGAGVNPEGNQEAWMAHIPCIPDPGDIDANCHVNLQDFAMFAGCFGLDAPTSGCPSRDFNECDLDGDGSIEISDFYTFVLFFSR